MFEASAGIMSADVLLAKPSYVVKPTVKGQKHALPTMTPWQGCRHITQLEGSEELGSIYGCLGPRTGVWVEMTRKGHREHLISCDGSYTGLPKLIRMYT